MVQANTIAGLGVFAVCVLGIGFMVLFLTAIARDENRIRAAHPVHARHGSGAAVNPAEHLAVGVVRITTALASPRVQRYRLELKHRLESRI